MTWATVLLGCAGRREEEAVVEEEEKDGERGEEVEAGRDCWVGV